LNNNKIMKHITTTWIWIWVKNGHIWRFSVPLISYVLFCNSRVAYIQEMACLWYFMHSVKVKQRSTLEPTINTYTLHNLFLVWFLKYIIAWCLIKTTQILAFYCDFRWLQTQSTCFIIKFIISLIWCLNACYLKTTGFQ
jgi:hypothetical protein